MNLLKKNTRDRLLKELETILDFIAKNSLEKALTFHDDLFKNHFSLLKTSKLNFKLIG